MQSFYVSDGDAFVATESTRGPWSPKHQHGGPPAALLARAIARLAVDRPMHVARFLLELHRPVPIGRVRVSARWTKPGNRVRSAEAILEADGTVVARAMALLVRTEAIDVPAAAQAPALPAPESLTRFVFPFFLSEVGYHTSVECRVTGGEFGTGRLAAWMKPLVPLVDAEPLTPLERVLVCVDSGNGLSVAIDLAKYTFVNPDLTCVTFRALEGEWLHMDARTRADRDGVGMAECALSDARGAIGRSVQTLILERRGG